MLNDRKFLFFMSNAIQMPNLCYKLQVIKCWLFLLQLYLLNMSCLFKTKIGRIIKDCKSLFYDTLDEIIFLAMLEYKYPISQFEL